MRRLRCGSSVYIHKKSSPCPAAALPGSGSSFLANVGVEGVDAEAESSSVVTPLETTDSSLGDECRGRCFSLLGDGSAVAPAEAAAETAADIARISPISRMFAATLKAGE